MFFVDGGKVPKFPKYCVKLKKCWSVNRRIRATAPFPQPPRIFVCVASIASASFTLAFHLLLVNITFYLDRAFEPLDPPPPLPPLPLDPLPPLPPPPLDPPPPLPPPLDPLPPLPPPPLDPPPPPRG